MKTVILGGGITGRIVNYLIPDSVVMEANSPIRMTHQYGTNYLWKEIEGFPSIPIRIVTTVDGQVPTIESIQRYKNKVGRQDEDKSEWGLQFQPETRGHFIQSYPETNIKYEARAYSIDLKEHKIHFPQLNEVVQYDQLISTIPLVGLVILTGLNARFPVNSFKYKPVFIKMVPTPPEIPRLKDTVNVNYLSDPTIQPYRYCDRFGERHYESLTPMDFPHKKLSPGKIWESSYTPMILQYLESFNIKCFGRYGKWSTNELLHETYEEVKQWRNANVK